MSVKVNGTTGVSLVQEPALAFVPKQNWIINGMFDVWQRGTSFSGAGYNADRWVSTFPNATISRQSFSVGQTDVPNAPKYFNRIAITSNSQNGEFLQRIEDVSKFAGKTVTLSFWIKSSVALSSSEVNTYIFAYYDGSTLEESTGDATLSISTSWKRIVKTFVMPSMSGKTIGSNSYAWVRIIQLVTTGTPTIDIANVCLVEGSILQECPNEPYVEVLLKCQRYYYRISSGTAYSYLGCTGIGATTTICQCVITFPNEMRIQPSAVEYSTLVVTDATANFAVTALSFVQNGKYSSVLFATVASGLVLNRPYQLLANNSTSAYLAFSAEL